MTTLSRLAAVTASLALAAVGALAAGPAEAQTGGAPTPITLADGLLTPLRAAVGPDGSVYVTENNAGQILRVGRGGSQVVYTDPDGNEVGGVSVAGRNLIFTVTSHDPSDPETNLDSWLKLLTPSGQVRTLADLHDYEAAANPDQHTTYGFRSIDPGCAEQWPAANGPASYAGAVDSHPYATYVAGGWTYVADAGANDVLAVSPRGNVHTVATLPAIPYTITAEALAGLGLPDCFLNAVYWFEPVPTDVEMGPGGRLYVSSLPGGPEGPQLGGRGSVFSVDPLSHRVRPVVTGLVEPTGVAVAPDGLYVAQLFGDEISKVTFGHGGFFGRRTTHTHHQTATVSTFASTTNPGDVEWTPQGLVATTNVLAGSDGTSAPAGELVLYPTHHGHHGHGYGHRHGHHGHHGHHGDRRPDRRR